MANGFDPREGYRASPGMMPDARTTTGYDAGLRSYMLSVYNYMLSGVLLSGLVAIAMARTGLIHTFFDARGIPNLLGWVVMLAPLGMVLVLGFKFQRMSLQAVQGLFWGFCVLMGMSFSTIFLRYTGVSIATTFFATAAAFAGLSLYGYTTQRDLSRLGTFLIMGLVGIIVAMVLNMFLHSGALSLAISILGVLIFAGLTASDTQKIKMVYYQVAGSEIVGKTAIMGALTLYLDFINLFAFLLQFMGAARE